MPNSLLMSGSSNEFLCRKWIRIHNYVSWLHWQSCKLRRKWQFCFGRLAKFQLGMQYCQYAWDLHKHSLYAGMDWLYFGQKSMKFMNENTQTATHSFPLLFVVTDCMKKILSRRDISCQSIVCFKSASNLISFLL